MANLVILAGIPGCGKSTWARSLLDLKYSIISSDDIRKQMFGSLKAAHDPETKKENNKSVFKEYHRLIEDRLQHSVDVVADATNLTRRSRDQLREIAEHTKAKLHLVLFKNIVQGLDRNFKRDDDRVVPENVMGDFVDRYFETLTLLPQEDYETVVKIESFS